MNDKSISQYNSTLKLIDGEYYIEDNDSKFGTLLLTNKEMKLSPYKTLSLQVGKFFLKFTVKKTFLSIIRCHT